MTQSKTQAKGNAQTVKSTFSRETMVSIQMQADKSIAWVLITNAAEYASWNSTVISIDGKIAEGEKIILKSTLDPKRTFKLKVKEFNKDGRLVWGDAMGKRVFTLKDMGNGMTEFKMQEKIGGPLFPLFAKMIPPFDDAFNQFAADLKKEAEKIQQSN